MVCYRGCLPVRFVVGVVSPYLCSICSWEILIRELGPTSVIFPFCRSFNFVELPPITLVRDRGPSRSRRIVRSSWYPGRCFLKLCHLEAFIFLKLYLPVYLSEALSSWNFVILKLCHPEAFSSWSFTFLNLCLLESLSSWSFIILKLYLSEALSSW